MWGQTEVYALMRALAAEGVAIWVIFSDMEEVIGVSDRVDTLVVSHFQPHADRPDMFGQKRALLSDDAPFVPRRARGTKGG